MSSAEIKYGAVVLNDGDPYPAKLMAEVDFKASIQADLDAGLTFDEAFENVRTALMAAVRKELQ